MASSNNEWLQIYQNNLTRPPQHTSMRWSGDVVATTTTTTTTASSVSNQLSPRPTNMRRRSRASRRTPTTLLNTDTANFRAMVQHFTGGDGGGGGSSTSYMAAHATIASGQALSSYSTDSSGSNYYEAGSRMLPPAPADYYNYIMAGDNGGDHQHRFSQRVQEGGMGGSVYFSGENNNGGTWQ